MNTLFAIRLARLARRLPIGGAVKQRSQVKSNGVFADVPPTVDLVTSGPERVRLSVHSRGKSMSPSRRRAPEQYSVATQRLLLASSRRLAEDEV